MRISFLTKRQYMQKDVIDDRYARLYELPNQLAIRGHHVQVICLSYRKRDEGHFIHFENKEGLLEWHSFNLGVAILPGLFTYLKQLLSLLESFKPDVLIGSSDCPHVIITAWVARRLDIPFYIDLYDNYESFGLAKLPGMRILFQQALKAATGISCVSSPLSEYIGNHYNKNVITIESTIMPLLFQSQNKKQSRALLKLPEQGVFIGVAGALNKQRGISLLYDSFIELAKLDSSLYLVLAGPVGKSTPIPDHSRVIYLGLLAHDKIPFFYSALDVAINCMLDTEFGRFAFPQKTYEIMACGTPFITASIGALKRKLEDYPNCLYEVENQADLMKKITTQISTPVLPKIKIPSWNDQAVLLESFISGEH